MTGHNENDLTQALRAIGPTISKCEMAQASLKPGMAQHTLRARRTGEFEIAVDLIKERLDT